MYIVSTQPIVFGSKVNFARNIDQLKQLVASLLFENGVVYVETSNGKTHSVYERI